MEAALAGADVFFGSLLFDYDQVEWLRARVAAIPYRLIFESSLELMSATQVGGRCGTAWQRRGRHERGWGFGFSPPGLAAAAGAHARLSLSPRPP